MSGVDPRGRCVPSRSVPPELSAVLGRLEIGSEEPRFWLESDLDLDGRQVKIWLLAIGDQLLVADGVSADPLFEISCHEISDFRLRSTVGSGFLQIRRDEFWIDVVRFSNALREDFASGCRMLQSMLKGEADSFDEAVLNRRRSCESCGLPLESPGLSCPRCVRRGKVIVRTLSLLRGHLHWVGILLLLMVAGIGLDLVPPYLTRILVDDVLAVDNRSPDTVKARTQTLLVVVLFLAGASLVRHVLSIFTGRISAKVGTTVTLEIRTRLFAKLERLGIAYYDRNPSGNLLTRLLNDAATFQGFIQQMAGGFLLSILRLIAIGGMLFWLDWRLAIYVLIPIPAVVLAAMHYWHRVHPRYYQLSDRRSRLSSTLTGFFAGIRLVKAFAQEKHESERFDGQAGMLQEASLHVQTSVATFSPFMAFVFSLGGFIVWFAGGRLVLSDTGLTLGTLMAFLGYLGMFYGPLQMLTQLTNWLTGFVASSQRVFEIFDTPEEPDADPELAHGPPSRGP